MSGEKISAGEVSISDLLSGKSEPKMRASTIPYFQRSYVWKKSKIKEFIDTVIQRDEGTYLGNIIAQNTKELGTGGADWIIDGQQRLLTISLVLLVLKNRGSFSSSKKDEIDMMLFEKQDTTGASFLNFQSEDHANVYRALLGGENVTNSEKHAFVRAYKDILKLIDSKIYKNAEIPEEEFLSRIKAIKVVFIKLPSKYDTFSVFESLNSKNVVLKPFQLIKNSLFQNASLLETDFKTINTVWESIENSFTKDQPFILFDQFLRYRGYSQYGYITGKEVFPKIRSDLTLQQETHLDPLSWVSLTKEDAELYARVIRGGGAFQTENMAQNAVGELGVVQKLLLELQVQQVFSVLFAISKVATKEGSKYGSRSFIVDDLKRLFVFSVFVKVLTIKPSSYETHYARFCYEVSSAVSNEELNAARKNLFESLLKLVGVEDKTSFSVKFNDKLVCRRPRERRVKGSAPFKKIAVKKLSFYENTSVISRLLQISQGEPLSSRVTIEHIIPQTKGWHRNWAHIKAPISLERFFLGNLTLLNKDTAEDKGFPDKVECYESDKLSRLPMNMRLIDKEDAHHKLFLSEDPRIMLKTRGQDIAGELFDKMRSMLITVNHVS
jgi:hypothetical protein